MLFFESENLLYINPLIYSFLPSESRVIHRFISTTYSILLNESEEVNLYAFIYHSHDLDPFKWHFFRVI